jgi:hypothetical protein
MSSRQPAADIFFGQDRYAAFALGTYHQVGSSLADSDIFVAARGLSESVVPEIDEEVLVVEGAHEEQARGVRSVLLERYSARDLWVQPTLPMELQSYIKELMEHGEIFIRLTFGRSARSEPYSLHGTTWLSPETVLYRSRPGGGVYEQYASRRALEGSGYIVEGEPREHLVEIPEDEVFHLRWPMAAPDPRVAPAQAALKLGKQAERYAERTLLAARAGAEPDETFLSIARARAGAFSGALEAQKITSARIKDMLFYPGAYEARVFPWVDELTNYFAADRILRSRIAICHLREYLFTEFNRQVLQPWSSLNGWADVTLGLRPVLFTKEDWRSMREELDRGTTTLDDVHEAVALEYESGHQYGRFARAQAEAAASESR